MSRMTMTRLNLSCMLYLTRKYAWCWFHSNSTGKHIYGAAIRGLWSGEFLFPGMPRHQQKLPLQNESMFRCAPHDSYQIQFFNQKTGAWENGAPKSKVQIITGFEDPS